jgi:hypothetical protein
MAPLRKATRAPNSGTAQPAGVVRCGRGHDTWRRQRPFPEGQRKAGWRLSATVRSTRLAGLGSNGGRAVGWLNPWSWNPDAVGRWELRISGFGRWIMVLITVGAAVGFLAWFGVSAANDSRLSRGGVTVAATVEDTAPYGKDTQYLLAFIVDGQTETYWSTDVRGLKVGDSVSVIVNRRDHAKFEPTEVYGHRWGSYLVLILASAGFAFLGVMVIRMDAASFRRYSRARYGHATDSFLPSALTDRPVGGRKGRAPRSRKPRRRSR